MARRCCARRAANDNDGPEMLSPQQRRANDAVPPGRANDNNGPAMLLPATTGPPPTAHPKGNSAMPICCCSSAGQSQQRWNSAAVPRHRGSIVAVTDLRPAASPDHGCLSLGGRASRLGARPSAGTRTRSLHKKGTPGPWLSLRGEAEARRSVSAAASRLEPRRRLARRLARSQVSSAVPRNGNPRWPQAGRARRSRRSTRGG
jgi:hypothetical protein